MSAAAIGALSCTNEVPIGQGQGGSSGAAGSVGGSAGSATGGVGGTAGSATGGTGAAVGGSAGVGTGGIGGVGASGGSATGGIGGTGGVGTGGIGGTGGSQTTCPTDESLVTQKIAAPNVSDVLVAGALYWSRNTVTDGSIHRLGSPNGTPEELASSTKYPAQSAAFERPDSLGHDGVYLYWRTKEGQAVWRAPISGAAAPNVVATVPAAFSTGTTAGLHDVLTVENGSVYWVQGPNPLGGNAVEFSIYSAPTGGGTATKLVSYASNPNNPDVPSQPLSLAADTTSLYFGLVGAPGSSKLVKIGTDGANPTDLFGIGHYLLELAGDVYMTSEGFVWRVPKAGGTASLVTQGLDKSSHFDVSQAIAEYAGTLYVSTFGSVGIMECCTCGWVFSAQANETNSSIVPLWSGTGRPTALGVSAGFSGLAFADIDNDQVVVIDLVL